MVPMFYPRLVHRTIPTIILFIHCLFHHNTTHKNHRQFIISSIKYLQHFTTPPIPKFHHSPTYPHTKKQNNATPFSNTYPHHNSKPSKTSPQISPNTSLLPTYKKYPPHTLKHATYHHTTWSSVPRELHCMRHV